MILPPESINISVYNPAELLVLRQRINALLPTSLAALNLDEELCEQLILAKSVMSDADDAAPNQRAQCVNTITSVLKQIVEMQESITTMESIKSMESALIETLKLFPDVQESFLKAYEARLI